MKESVKKDSMKINKKIKNIKIQNKMMHIMMLALGMALVMPGCGKQVQDLDREMVEYLEGQKEQDGEQNKTNETSEANETNKTNETLHQGTFVENVDAEGKTVKENPEDASSSKQQTGKKKKKSSSEKEKKKSSKKENKEEKKQEERQEEADETKQKQDKGEEDSVENSDAHHNNSDDHSAGTNDSNQESNPENNDSNQESNPENNDSNQESNSENNNSNQESNQENGNDNQDNGQGNVADQGDQGAVAHTQCDYDGGVETKKATCSQNGEITYTCKICGNTKTEKTPKTAHKLFETWWEEPTCTYEGSGHGIACENCDYFESLPTGALGHLPDEGTMWKKPDCMHEGYVSHICQRCGANLEDTTVPIDPNAHDWQKDDKGWYCSICGKTKSKKQLFDIMLWNKGVVGGRKENYMCN